jgi:hypothetical protein
MESDASESDVPAIAVSSCLEECSDFHCYFAGFLSRADFANPEFLRDREL